LRRNLLPFRQQTSMGIHLTIFFTKFHLITVTGELAKEPRDLLQSWHDAADSGQCVRARMSVQNHEQQLDWQLQLLVRRHPARVQRILGLVRRRRGAKGRRRRPQVGSGTAGQPGRTPGLRPPQKRQHFWLGAH
jgi:hypothetical protein